MNITNMKRIRDSIRTNAEEMILVCDNAFIFSSKSCFMLWDDTNEVLTVIRPNIDKYSQMDAPIEVIVTEYCDIQYIKGAYNDAALSSLSDFGLTADDILEVKKLESSLNNFVPTYNKEDDTNNPNPWTK